MKNKRKIYGDHWLYLPIETKNRELDSKILLALVGIQKGYNVVLGHKSVLKKVLGELPHGISSLIGFIATLASLESNMEFLNTFPKYTFESTFVSAGIPPLP